MSSPFIRFILLSAFMFLFVSALSGEQYLYGEFVYNLNPDFKSPPFPEMSIERFENKPDESFERQVVDSLFEEAKWVFSAMIYGLKISYTPSDRIRNVDRFFEADLLAEIQRGDERLEVYDTFIQNNQYHMFVRYRLDDYQKRRIDYWNSGVFTSASSYGYFPYFGENSRINAMKDAIRIALENILKPQEYNKPSLIEAEVLFRNSPSISVDSGQNRAFVKIRAEIKNVEHYRVNN